jgi:hypothetical protein
MSGSNDRRRRRRRTILVLLAAAALSLFTFAFTAANVVPDTKAGDGAGDITGYTVTNVQYQLDTADASLIESVSFTLDDAASSVRAKVNAASTTYTTCTNTGGNNWSCDFATDPTVLSADELRVIATS